jgi:hypothetical protein
MIVVSPQLVFELANPLALVGWALLLFSPLMPKIADRIGGYGIPVALAAVYLVMLVVHAPNAEGGFGSLDAVMVGFTVPGIAMAGWLHYLALDLFVGGWEVRTARREAIPHWQVIPCLALTLFAAPVGLTLFLGLRRLHRRHGVAESQSR